MHKLLFTASIFSLLIACSRDANDFDASGTFEAEETIISSEVNGVIQKFNVEEGQVLDSAQSIGYIDSTQLYLKKKQLIAQVNALLSKRPDIARQLSSLQAQLKAAEKDQTRIRNLVNSDAAPAKQLDDINAQVEVLTNQIEALNSSLDITTEGLGQEAIALRVQIEQVNDQLAKCNIISPVAGTVLSKFAENGEMTMPGKPLFKIADMRTIILRAYITGDQLPQVKLNQVVKVFTDNGKDAYRESQGRISWISDKAEFTPKTIQTKDERANLVYAIKILVPNDGSLKLGMYGEIKFQ